MKNVELESETLDCIPLKTAEFILVDCELESDNFFSPT